MTQSPLVDISRAHNIADELAREWGLAEALRPYRAQCWTTSHADLPSLHLEDVTGIPFVEAVSGIQEYQHRARVRAKSGDLFAAGTKPAEGYETYCRQMLELGKPEFVYAEGENSMAVARACFDPPVFEHLEEVARQSGGLVIHPYMAIESVWRLARRLAQRVDAPISVLGPPPPVLWIANDKSRLSELVENVLGTEWIVETRRSSDPQKLALALGEMAQNCEAVGLKRTRCASAMGNSVFDAAVLCDATDDEIRKKVDDFLEHTEWCDGEDVLVVEWRHTDLSPSTQLWIPPVGDGPPVLDGIYEQLLEGPQKVFLGSRPSTLPDALNRALGDASLQVAHALQKMGYIGRCSFDFIVNGDPDADFEAQIIECNGRWGGTSTPMYLVDRLIGDAESRPAYVATDYYLPESLLGMTFEQLLDALDGELYSPKTKSGRFVLYNVGPLKEQGKFDIISFGDDPEDAHRGLEEVLVERLEQQLL